VPAPPPNIPGLIDTHCHLDYAPMIDDLAATLARAAAAGVERCIHIGCRPDAWQPALALARAHPDVFCGLGVHPHDATLADAATLAELAVLVRDPRCVGVGETGLDYFYDRSPRDVQQAAMAAHLAIARAADKPVILHIRDAHADAWAVVDAATTASPAVPPAVTPAVPSVAGVVHCFTGTPDEAREWLVRGYALSFSGIATFPASDALREAARICPEDRILLETDAPYLAPVPVRGRKNEPANVAYTCARLAAVRGVAPEALARAANANAAAIFRLPARG
jgi:TatD DNase family protein